MHKHTLRKPTCTLSLHSPPGCGLAACLRMTLPSLPSFLSFSPTVGRQCPRANQVILVALVTVTCIRHLADEGGSGHRQMHDPKEPSVACCVLCCAVRRGSLCICVGKGVLAETLYHARSPQAGAHRVEETSKKLKGRGMEDILRREAHVAVCSAVCGGCVWCGSGRCCHHAQSLDARM